VVSEEEKLAQRNIIKKSEGTCGNGVFWSLESGTLTISGNGNMTDYDEDGAPWYADRTSITSLMIEKGVVYIGSNAFRGLSIEELNIPRTVIGIGEGAFYDCSSFQKLFYQGKNDVPDFPAFSWSNPEIICVAPDYNSFYFYNLVVSVYNPLCNEYKSLFTNCSMPRYVDGQFIMENNEDEWENQTTECVQFKCINETGESWSICNSTDDMFRFCHEDQCLSWPKPSGDKNLISVNIEIDKVKSDDENLTTLIYSIVDLIKIGNDLISIDMKKNDNGDVISIVLFVKEKETANKISEVIEGIDKESTEYKTIFYLIKRVTIEYNKSSGSETLSKGNQEMMNIVTFIICMVIMEKIII